LAIEIQPLHQFEIHRLVPIHIGGVDVSYTNSALLMTIVVVLVTALLVLGTRKRALVPGRWQSLAEMSYEFVADMVETNVGHGGREFFPFVFTLFMFILFANFLGMIPYSYTVTSQIVVTFALAAVVFIGVTIVGIVRHGFRFLRLFVPQGVPLVLLLLLVPIELLSYFIRPFTLAIRLFANMLAGHMLILVMIGLLFIKGWGGILGVPLAEAFYIFEVVIVVTIQAFIFAALSAIYIGSAIEPDH
jgi:F-type H+-transporting ATPase subunit a